MKKDLLKKILSHRNRSSKSGYYENTLEGIEYVLKKGVKYVEFDIRSSKDGVYFLHHHTVFNEAGLKFNLAEKTSDEIEKARYKNNQKIPKLEDILKLFREIKKDGQVLAVDLRDFGGEERVLNLIKKYNLLKSVILFTWAPQSLFEFDKIFEAKPEYKIPIFFPHTRIDSIFNYFFFTYFINLFKNFVSFGEILFLNNHTYKKDLGKFAKGYYHAVYFKKFPDDILKILQKNNGGICVSVKNPVFPKWGLKYLKFFKKHNLKVAVYGTFFGIWKLNKKKYFENLASNENIDIVFMDDIDEIL